MTTASAERAQLLHDREKVQLNDNIAKHREQCEAAQQRVLDMHKSMLEDLKTRDERTREQQSVYLRERAEAQAKTNELSRESERLREAQETQKRRITELETSERECKRLRTQVQEHSMIVTRLETENMQLRQMSDSLNDERETLRQENLRMEGELAVLRAEKQLNDARRDMS